MFGDRWWRLPAITVSVLAVGASVGAAAAAPDQQIVRFAGDGNFCSSPRCGAGGPAAKAHLDFPSGVAADMHGNVYIADGLNQVVWRVSAQGTIGRFAGDGRHCTPRRGCGDGGPATSARLFMPAGVAVDRAGNVYIADSNDHEVRKVYANGIVTRFAGTGQVCARLGGCGDGGPAFLATMETPFGVAVDASGNVYVTDLERNEVRKIDAGGTITRLAGSGRLCSTPGKCGDGLAAIDASLGNPTGVAVDAAMNVYLADPGDREVRRLAQHP